MARFKITLEYDGSRFSGWQLQKNERSIQGDMMEACRTVFQTDRFELYGAGRTDAGVHALAQVAHLEVDTRLAPHIMIMKLNDELTHDINILRIEKAPARFHARHDAIARSYIYQISRRRNAFGKKFMWWVKDELDVKAMQEVCRLFVGMKDFQSFTNEKGGEKSTIVELQRLEIHERGDLLVVHIIGSHFLWKMVRRIVGVLVEVGRRQMTPQQIKSFFEQASNEPARLTAPPAGLFLERVYYPGDTAPTGFKMLFSAE